MPSYHLAQLNIGRLKAPEGDPQVAEFFDNLDRINALAEAADGFVWRLADDSGNATAFRAFDEETLVNMSVWRDVDSLKRFVYETAHVEFLRRRSNWFEHMTERHMVLWWIPAGHEPSIAEAQKRLQQLRDEGDSAQAFTFRSVFPAPE